MSKNHETSVLTAGQMKELSSAILEAIPANLPTSTAQYWIGNKKRLQKALREALGIQPFFDLLADWQQFYLNVFGGHYDFSDIVIPEKKSGFDRLIIVAPGMTPQVLFNKCSGLFKTWKYTDKDLDEVIISDRTPAKGAYAIWLRDRIEADEEMKNISANQIKQQQIITCTLEERILYELKYFKETNQHLDVQKITLCAGSRSRHGHVPSVSWGDSKMVVRWYDPGNQNDNLRARAAVI
ncbi:MAG: hypothetical protein UW06_C0049G0002 [Parcubacteria group bacterium GW2011_GWE1_43_8]|nr:MAG: hypothetical protein UW06_C0049G0002 [Parcubacteria group bacterium GW2011_GWE1_43_8]